MLSLCVFLRTKQISFIQFSTLRSPFDLGGSEAKCGQEEGEKHGLQGAASLVWLTFPSFCRTWLVVRHSLGEKACRSVTTKGAGTVVAVRLVARGIFVIVVSGCKPTVLWICLLP